MRDVDASLDQLEGLLTLEARQKLKGQGTISDSEAKGLAKAATVIGGCGSIESSRS